MKPFAVQAIAAREKELFTDCPHCAAMVPLFDRLIELMGNGGRHPVTFLVEGGLTHPRRQVHGHLVQLHCATCRNTRRVLTELGEALAALIPPASQSKEEEIPF